MSKKEIVEDLMRVKPKNPNKKLRFSVDLPISINHMYYNTSRGGKRLTAKAEKYVLQTKAKVMEVMYDIDWKTEPKGVWQYLDLVIYMPDKRIRDASNMLKLLLDTIEGCVYSNDYTVLPRIQSVELDRDNPRLVGTITHQKDKDRVDMLKKYS